LNTSASARVQASEPRRVPAWLLALPVLVVLVATTAGVLLVVGDRSSSPVWVAADHARVGGKAPAFRTWDLNGRKVDLSGFAGRPVLLTFWATWCTVCREELPALQGLQEEYRPAGLAVLAVNYEESGSDRLRQFLASLHVNLEAVIDPAGSIASAYAVDIGLPDNVLVDRSGTVAQILVGAAPIASIEDAIKQALAPAQT
jgi:thiol-disulfide isomerase/thioredoxin